jgi:hypothetical protein
MNSKAGTLDITAAILIYALIFQNSNKIFQSELQ